MRAIQPNHLRLKKNRPDCEWRSQWLVKKRAAKCGELRSNDLRRCADRRFDQLLELTSIVLDGTIRVDLHEGWAKGFPDGSPPFLDAILSFGHRAMFS